MKKIFILFWMLCGITLNALAQEQLEISGTVTDATGEALIGVSVTVKDAKGLGTITNAGVLLPGLQTRKRAG